MYLLTGTSAAAAMRHGRRRRPWLLFLLVGGVVGGEGEEGSLRFPTREVLVKQRKIWISCNIDSYVILCTSSPKFWKSILDTIFWTLRYRRVRYVRCLPFADFGK